MFQTATTKRVIGLALAIALTTAAGPVVADEMNFDSTQAPSLLVGTWRVTTTPYNCVTGQVFPQFARPSLITFGAGGTIVEGSANPDFQPGQRSSGHGYWEREGRLSFRAVFEGFILFTSVVTPPATPRYVRGTRGWTTASRCRTPITGRATPRSRSSMSLARLCRRAGARRRLPSACVAQRRSRWSRRFPTNWRTTMVQVTRAAQAKRRYERGRDAAGTSGRLVYWYRTLLLAAVAVSMTGCSDGSGGGAASDASAGGNALPPRSTRPDGRGTVVVTVTDVLGAPLAGARVDINTYWADEDKRALADSSGQAEVKDVIADRFFRQRARAGLVRVRTTTETCRERRAAGRGHRKAGGRGDRRDCTGLSADRRRQR